MADRRELELRLATPGYQSRIVVDGVELSNIQSVTVHTDVNSATTVEVGYIVLHQPFILRGQMVVVYDGPAEEAPPTCGICGIAAPTAVLPPDWAMRPTGDICAACAATLQES